MNKMQLYLNARKLYVNLVPVAFLCVSIHVFRKYEQSKDWHFYLSIWGLCLSLCMLFWEVYKIQKEGFGWVNRHLTKSQSRKLPH
jgi:hypothetical protein